MTESELLNLPFDQWFKVCSERFESFWKEKGMDRDVWFSAQFDKYLKHKFKK